MIRAALLLATLAAGCGIKAAPRPPLKPAAPAERRPQAEGPACGTCEASPPPAPRPP